MSMRSSIWLLVLHYFVLVAVHGSNSHSRGFSTKNKAFADSFPSIDETLEMAQLSRFVYHFRGQNETYCASFNELPYVHCEWYHHDTDLGTQVMLVSNSRKKYLAVVFAGTDDFRTSILDADLRMKSFGDNDTVHLEDPMIKVHEGFDDAVFNHVLWNEISSRLEHLIRKYRRYRLWTTGHSLGAAAALFTATALVNQGHTVTSINFGCPQTGNDLWRDYFNATSPLKDRLQVWRSKFNFTCHVMCHAVFVSVSWTLDVALQLNGSILSLLILTSCFLFHRHVVVQGWDLVPRLPEFFFHVGHTIQIWSKKHHKYDKSSPNQICAYYHHYGSPDLGYVGVPCGWSSKPYFWVPGALASHSMGKYVDHLQDLLDEKLWVSKFEVVQPQALDDDIWDNPPDDAYEMDYFQQFDADEKLQEPL
jgi:hypothetical protein